LWVEVGTGYELDSGGAVLELDAKTWYERYERLQKLGGPPKPRRNRRGRMVPMYEFTQLLNALNAGDPQAAAQLLPLVYDELRRLAAQKLVHEKPGQTLDATALVHEAYLRLVGAEDPPHWDGRSHFFAAAAEAMRRILIEQARRKASQRQGGHLKRHPLEQGEIATPEPSLDVLAINEALERFEQIDPLKARLVKLRYFIGMTIPEAAEALGISTTTADRYWAYARAWLHAELKKR
jgi:RNA polymerase sigma factor (TIGR02999 family)